MASFAETALTVAAPEVGLPMEAIKQLAPHAPTFLMMPLMGLAILLVIIGIIVFSTDKSKSPGILLLMLGLLVGGGAFFVIGKTEGRAK